MGRSILLIAAIVMLLGQSSVQSQERLLSFALRGGYTSTAKIFYNPDSPSPDLRGQYNGIDDLYGLGFELRWVIPDYSVARNPMKRPNSWVS
jgi:hypothetical protein